MRNNKFMYKVLALGLAGTLALSMTGCQVTAEAKTIESSSESVSESGAEEKLETAAKQMLMTSTKSDETGKEETVYVIGDSEGNTKEILVNGWLKNGDGLDELKDVADLTDIENTKGDEAYKKNSDGTISWDAHGNDIYYRGNSTKELPIDVKVTYKLDGKEVSTRDLEGADGHVTVEFTYDNKISKTVELKGKKVNIKKPCVVVSGMLFDLDNASNVKVTNGKVVNDGNRSIAIGVAMPGMREDLGLEDMDRDIADKAEDLIPESVTVEADVKNFAVPATVSFASFDLPVDLNMEELKAEKSDLNDSAKKLEDGAGELENGAKKISGYLGDLKDGADKLSSGTKTLSAGAGTLKKGAEKLADGTHILYSSVAALPDGTKALLEGSQKIQAALKSGDSSSAERYGIYEAVTAMGNGAEQLSGVLEMLMSGTENINQGALQIAQGAKSGSEDPSAYGIYEAACALESGLNNAIGNLQTGLSQAAGTIGNINTYNSQITSDINSIITDENLTEEQRSTLTDALAYAAYSDKTAAGVQSALANTSIDTSSIEYAVSGIKTGAENISTGAMKLALGAKSGSSEPETYGLYEAASAAYAGAKQLSESAADLAANIDLLANENNTGALVKGLEDLSAKSTELVSAVGQVSEGANELSSGSKELSGGVDKLSTGADSLAKGAGELKEGSNTLTEGIMTFNKEGIQKVADLIGEKGDNIYERLTAVCDYAKEQMPYSGCEKNVECKTQYIFKTSKQ